MASRIPFVFTVLDANGTGISGERVRLVQRGTSTGYGTGTIISDTLFSGASGGGTVPGNATKTLSTNSQGQAVCYFDVPGTHVPGTITVEFDDNGSTATPTGVTGYRDADVVPAGQDISLKSEAAYKKQFVATYGSNSNSGRSMGDAQLTIAGAITAQTTGQIEIGAGQYALTAPQVLGSHVHVKGSGIQSNSLSGTEIIYNGPVEVTTTLGAAIANTTDRTFTVGDASGFLNGVPADIIEIESERMIVTAKTSTTITVRSRGDLGTTAATHVNGTTVTQIPAAVILAPSTTDPEGNWSRASLRNLRIINGLPSSGTRNRGVGLLVINANNDAVIEDVQVGRPEAAADSFPDGAAWFVNTGTLGTNSGLGFYKVRGLWANGGATPLGVMANGLTAHFDLCGIDGDVAGTNRLINPMTIWENPVPTAGDLLITGMKIEVKGDTTDGIRVDGVTRCSVRFLSGCLRNTSNPQAGRASFIYNGTDPGREPAMIDFDISGFGIAYSAPNMTTAVTKNTYGAAVTTPFTYDPKQVRRFRKQADQAVTNSTTMVDVTGSEINIPAGETWDIRWTIYYKAGTTGLMKLGVVADRAGALKWGVQALDSTVTTTAGITTMYATTGIAGTPVAVGAAGIANPLVALVTATIRASTGASPANIKLQFAQNVSNGTATTIMADSSFVAMKVEP